jgi:hypothetical protein
METALQEAIAKTKNTIAELKARQDKVSHQYRIQVDFIGFKIGVLKDNLLMLQSLLPKECEQILTAYSFGSLNKTENLLNGVAKITAQEYYETNFNK